MSDHFHEMLDRLGLPVGSSLVIASVTTDWIVANGPTMFNVFLGMAGLSCTLLTTALRVLDYLDKRRARR